MIDEIKGIRFNPQHLSLSRKAAAEGMVLLKNENNVLPLRKDRQIALFGRNQFDVFKGGGGAADLWAVPVVPFAEALDKTGNIYKPLLEKYKRYSEANLNKTMNKFPPNYTYFLREFPLEAEEVSAAAQECDTAVIFIGRFAAEGHDIEDKPGEYRITPSEEKMISLVTEQFEKTVLVLNLPSLMDISFLDKYPINAVINAFMPGLMAGYALADILYGDATPSGKLPDSWCKTDDGYPSENGFSAEQIIYSEGIYMGYRYFDTFKKEVEYPFGYGLSYTEFSLESISEAINGTVVTVKIKVENTGKYSGKETVQCYLSCPDGELDKPYQVLCGFEKTQLLAPDESEIVTINIDLTEFSSYSEKDASYVLEAGDYILRMGTHSRNTTPICIIPFSKTVICRKVKNRLAPQESIKELKKAASDDGDYSDIKKIIPELSAFKTEIVSEKVYDIPKQSLNQKFTFEDVLKGKCSAEELALCLSKEELALFLTGDGVDKRNAAGIIPNIELAKGEGSHTHPVKALGIPASTMQDGPVGVRASAFEYEYAIPPTEDINGNDCICYPSVISLAATWNRKLVYDIGCAITEDMERYGFNGLCAPGVNLHRNPRCGRNFEYFSEDPFLAAEMAIGFIKGIEEKPTSDGLKYYTVLKHFVCNNSEDKRLIGDSVLSERCARELYLRVFEYVIKKASPASVMTSYNKVNGKYTAANAELLEGILRTEWNYKGWIMTDWDVYAPITECLINGTDTAMPGQYVSYEEMEKQGLSYETAIRRASHLIEHLSRTRHYN